MTPFERILQRLEGVRGAGEKRAARCPSHDDQRASLSVAQGEDGRVLLKCFAGCQVEDIVAKLGLEMRDLFPGNHRGRGKRGVGERSPRGSFEDSNGSANGLTLEDYAEAKKLPPHFLRALGLTTITYEGRSAIRIPYLDSSGVEVAVQFRIALEGDQRFKWKKGSKPTLYGQSRLDAPRAAGHVTVVEGPSDAQTLWHHGFPAVGIPAASAWREAWVEHFDGIPIVYVVIEPDNGGTTVLGWLSKSRIRDRARLVRLDGAKDPSQLHVLDPARFKERFQTALAAAIPWVTIETKERNRKAAESFGSARLLLHDNRLLDRVGELMAAQGYAGDCRPPKLAYIAMTSRLLRRPMNLAFVAQSSAGKNRAVDAALELMPPDACYLVRASSPRALIYTDEDFKHRAVIVAEADSIPEDGPAASAIRSIAEDNCMTYEVVERNPNTGRFETRRIEKPGPTGLITTSTKSLGEQMGTRLLEVSIPDDAAQTRAVLRVHAERAIGNDTNTTAEIVTAFHDLQRWLAVAGDRRVSVPFAGALAELVPDQAVRMRRDFRQLLTCIEAVAVLHQCQRDRAADGSIEATIDDYSMARNLLLSVFNTVATEGVTPAIRGTVEAVKAGEEISEAMLAERLKLARSTVHWRVRRALQGGWLLNTETRRGHAAKLSLGVPLPCVSSALPEVERVRALFEGSTRARGDIPPAPPGPGGPLPEARESFEI